METADGDFQTSSLNRLADLLIEAKFLADAGNDEVMKELLTEALFRMGHLLAKHTKSRDPEFGVH